MPTFQFGGAVNSTNIGVSGVGNYLYTPGYAMPTIRQAASGNRPFYISSGSITPAYASAAYEGGGDFGAGYDTGGNYYANPPSTFTFYVTSQASLLAVGRNTSNGLTTHTSFGDTFAGGMPGQFTYAESPAAPSGVIAYAGGADTINVQWTAPTDTGGIPLTYYRIEASTTPDFASPDTEDIIAPATSGQITGLTPGAYYIRVAARNNVTDNYSTTGPFSFPTTASTGTVWSYSGDASWRAVVTNPGDMSDPFGNWALTYTTSVTAISDGQPVSAGIACYVEGSNTGDLLVNPELQWIGPGNTLITTDALDPVLIPDETTTFLKWEGTAKPIGALYARFRLVVPQFVTGSTPNPDMGMVFYADAAIITNGATLDDFVDGNSAGGVWMGATNNSVSQVVTGDSDEPIYDALLNDNRIFSVREGETIVVSLSTQTHAISIDGPVPSDITPAPLGSYNVVDADGVPVPASDWSAAGGYIRAAIGESIGEIILTLGGPISLPGYTGPFAFASVSGTQRNAELRLSGTAIVNNPDTIRFPTGSSTATQEVGASIDSPMVATLEDLYVVAPWVVQRVGGPVTTLTATVPTKDLEGFGVTPGALIRYHDSMYRVTSVNFSGISATVTAQWYVTAGMSDDLWYGETAGDYDDFWSGYKAKDAVVMPLRAPDYLPNPGS